MTIKLEMLRVFRVVAEQGSLATASEVLGRTPSAISMMLRQLEENVGAPLFETDRKNRLTPLGQLVLDESARATDAFGRCVDSIRRNAASLAGTVRIAAVPSATVTVLPGAIAAFRELRPEVRLEISDVDSRAVERRVLLDEADIGILSTGPNGDSRGIPILEDELGIVCRPDGEIARRHGSEGAGSWDMIALEPLIANPLCALVEHPRVAAALEECNLEARNTSALLSFVRSGLGVTVLPRNAVVEPMRDLHFVAPDDPPARRQLRKICRPDGRMSPAAAAFWSTI